MNAIDIKVGQIGIRYLIDGSQKGGMGMFELLVPPGAIVPPPHSHSDNEELIYVVEGKLRYSVGTEARDLAPGEGMHTPKGVIHAFSNPFDSPAKALIAISPDIGAQYFRDVAAVVNAGGPPDKNALIAVMRSYGLVPAAPN
jgi:quercetin dioxygenase-like cupin family protein